MIVQLNLCLQSVYENNTVVNPTHHYMIVQLNLCLQCLQYVYENNTVVNLTHHYLYDFSVKSMFTVCL